MKIFKSLAFILIAIFTSLISVNAQTTNVVKIGNTEYATLEQAVEVATEEETLTLIANANITDIIVIEKDLTIDLNGYNITQTTAGKYALGINKGNVTLTGTGIITSGDNASYAVRIQGSTNKDDQNYVVATIDENVTIESNGYAVIIAHNNGHAYGVVVNVAGKLIGTSSGFFINGSVQDVIGNVPQVNIKDGAVLKGDGPGIYAAGYGKWTIGKATITGGDSGIGLKAGKFEIDGASITATGEKKDPVGFSNGLKATGAAIQIETSADYADHIEFSIKNAIVTSENGYAFLEYMGETAILSIAVDGGTYKSADGLEIFNTSENFKLTKFISGGTFSADVNEYVAEGYVTNARENNYVVEKIKHEVSVTAPQNGKVEVDKTTAAAGETVTITVTPNTGFIISEIIVTDAANNKITITDNKFIMAAGKVNISVVFKEEITITTDIPVIDITEKVEEVTVGIKEESKVEDVLLDSLNADNELVEKVKDTSVKVVVDVYGVDEEKLDEKIKSAIEEKVSKGTIAEYFDITIAVKDAKTNKKIATISELTEEIELTILLPENLKNTNKDINRKYFVVREHDGRVDLIEAKISEDGNYLTFKSRDFSTYALAYEDTKVESSTKPETESPKTGDNVVFYAIISVISICGLGFVVKTKKFN